MRRAVLSIALLLAAPVHAARISVGTVSAGPGATVGVPLTFAGEGTMVAALQVDLAIGDPITSIDVTASPAVVTAGKQVSTVSISGGVRVTIFGANPTLMPDGTVATLTARVSPTATSGSYPITASNAQAADLSGLPVSISQSSGAVNVGSTAASWILPSSARVTGANDAFWTTDLVVSNTGNLDGTLTVKFLGHDADGRFGPESSLAVRAGRTVVVADVLSLFGLSSGYGALQLSSTVTSFAISGQTSTPGASCTGGTFGQSVPAVASSDFITPGNAKSLVGIREDGAFHTNLVLANGGQAGCDVNVSLVLGNGTLAGTKKVTLQPLGMTQLSNVARVLGATGDVSGARIIVSPATSGAAVAAYASVIDNLTNDPRTLLAQ